MDASSLLQAARNGPIESVPVNEHSMDASTDHAAALNNPQVEFQYFTMAREVIRVGVVIVAT